MLTNTIKAQKSHQQTDVYVAATREAHTCHLTDVHTKSSVKGNMGILRLNGFKLI